MKNNGPPGELLLLPVGGRWENPHNEKGAQIPYRPPKQRGKRAVPDETQVKR